MHTLLKVGSGLLAVGLFLIAIGGMQVRGGPDGTWIQVNLIHGIGGGLMLCGTVLTMIAASRTPRG
jgi:hypothetical protein